MGQGDAPIVNRPRNAFTKPSMARDHVTRLLANLVSDRPGSPYRPESPWRPSLAVASALLEVLSHLDERIVVEKLTNGLLYDWRQSMAALRSAIRLGESGGTIDLKAWHAKIILDTLKLLPDVLAPQAEPRLAFVTDDKLRESIARDVDSLEGFLRDGEWKAATVIGGSVAEALLLDTLMSSAHRKEAEAEIVKRKAGNKRWDRPLDELDLWQLVDLAKTLKLVSDEVASVCDGARSFRNLIHPGRERAAAPCDKGTALAAAAAVENLMRALSSARRQRRSCRRTQRRRKGPAPV